MEIDVKSNGVLVRGIADFNLSETLECGQCFRWDALSDGSYRGVAFHKPLRVSVTSGGLWLEGASEQDFLNLWRPYFDLSLDYGLIRGYLSDMHPILAEAAGYAPGIRILRQDPWEALCSFILSQNNNIPRIKGIILRLCQLLGEPCGDGAFDYSFPSPAALAACREEDLAPLRAGWRAAYLLDAARKAADGTVDFKKVKALPLPQAREALMKIKGVGPKVAECALLYGFHRLEAFPMDVWMKRAMEALFPKKAPEDFGPYAGIAQQYIFHYSRRHKELFEPA